MACPRRALAAALVAVCAALICAGPAMAGASVPLIVTTQPTLTFADGVGFSFSDTATLSEAASGLPAPTGTVTFDVYGPIDWPFTYGPSTCAGTPQYTSTNSVNAAGTSATSDTFAMDEAGPHPQEIYLFTTSYSGDSTYAPVSSECGSPGESMTVPFVAEALSESEPVTPAVGGSSVRISGLMFSPTAFSVVTGADAHMATLTKKSKRGTTANYILSAGGTVVITISKLVRSSRVAQRVGALVRPGRKGHNSFAFTGRFGSRVLTPGSYLADAVVN